MSNYFETLRKLERDRKAWSKGPAIADLVDEQESAGDNGVQGEADPARVPGRTRGRVPTPVASFELATRQGAFASLFDNLRIMSPQGTLSRVVLAGVTGREPVEAVTAGLVMQARRRNLSTTVAELIEAGVRSTLRIRGAAAGSPSGGPARTMPGQAEADGHGQLPPADPLTLDFRSGVLPPGAADWLDSVGSANDLLLIEAPSLNRTLDGALLARACDGLVIVVEPYVTAEESLAHVSARAAAIGCTVLGIVLAGVTSPWPKWIERFMSRAIA